MSQQASGAAKAGGKPAAGAWSSGKPSGLTKAASTTAGSAAGATSAQAAAKSPATDRTLFLFANMIGCAVQVLSANGTVYRGILHSATPDSSVKGADIHLRMAYNKPVLAAETPFASPQAEASNVDYLENIIIKASELAQISVVGVNLGFRAARPAGSVDSFTDTGISRGSGPVQERHLTRWESDGAPAADLSLDESIKTWTPEEMFATSKKGTTYHENFYTVPLNKSGPEYKEKLKRAIELEREILGSTSTKVHVMEERGYIDEKTSEEDRYGSGRSATAATTASSASTYVPPNKRAQSDPATKTAPAAKSPAAESVVRGLKTFQEVFKIAETPAAPAVDAAAVAAKTEETPASAEPVAASSEKAEKAAAAEVSGEPATAPKKTLNKDAKPFVFNRNAASFTPSAPAAAPALQSTGATPTMPAAHAPVHSPPHGVAPMHVPYGHMQSPPYSVVPTAMMYASPPAMQPGMYAPHVYGVPAPPYLPAPFSGGGRYGGMEMHPQPFPLPHHPAAGTYVRPPGPMPQPGRP